MTLHSVGVPLNTHGCCIRFDDTTTYVPRIHENSVHACVGVESLEIVGDGLRVNLTKRADDSGYPIVTMGGWWDEASGGLGLEMGFTGGVGYATLYFTEHGTPSSPGAIVPMSDTRLYAANRNIWVEFVTLADEPEWEALPTLDEGWSSASAGIVRNGPVVSLKGELWGGVTGSTHPIATLPQKFWPTSRIAVLLPDIAAGTSDGVLNVSTAGVMYVIRGNGGASSPGLSLGGVSWVTAQPNED